MGPFNLRHQHKLALAVAASLQIICGHALAEDKKETVELEDYVLKESYDDTMGIMPTQPVKSVFGLGKSIAETPRSVSDVSSDLIQKYGMRDINDMIRLTPGAYTSSFFGIPGALSLRGDAADNYFRGFKRIENGGNYATPIRAASSVDIVRGPVSPIYGAGKVGGYMNFTPKSSKSGTSQYLDKPTGDVGVTVGSYGQFSTFAEGGTPFSIGEHKGGVYGYLEREDSHTYFDNVDPKSTIGQLAFDLDLSDNLRTEFGGQYMKADRIQNPGWNRVTQDLIDHGTYTTGAPSKMNSRGDVLYPDDVRTNIQSGVGFPPGSGNSKLDVFCQNYSTCFFNPKDPNAALTNPGTTKLKNNQVFTDSRDRGESTTATGYFDLIWSLDNDMELKNQFFYDSLNHKKYTSYGFTADYDAYTWEDKVSLSFPYKIGDVSTSNIVGVNYRYYSAMGRESYLDEILDRRDLSVGPTPDDSFDIAHLGNVQVGPGQYLRNYNTQNASITKDTGAFMLSDMTWQNWNLLLGYRLDYYDAKATEKAQATNGDLVGDANGDGTPDKATGHDLKDSFSGSLSYHTPWGFIPYFTYAESTALSTNQAGGVAPSDVSSGGYLQDSKLREFGLKYTSPNGNIYGALAYYDQEKSYRDSTNGSTILVNGKGYEGELRWMLNQNFSMTASATKQKVREKGQPFTVLNTAAVAKAYGMDPSQLYGMRFFDPTGSVLGGEFDRAGVPEWVTSLYGNYTQPTTWGGNVNASLGFTWVDKQWADNQKQIQLPAYTVWNGSIGYSEKSWEALLSVNNLLNEKYFTSANLFDSTLVFPSAPRTYTATFTYKF
ncbi:TonB-dependent siderophore receptor [Pseudomonas sp. TH31]|uniref:TonB-dependent siderophore receptor n=1 Tax=Pseudomonas sp. TH31 TaxID=2796396 RepID=UPI0019143520|nr:TonB-dependent receptor [Pseudomonas sp. TH31]MBK5417899.1 TonB-dependent receptor [Pseudomonas sp. TH31]